MRQQWMISGIIAALGGLCGCSAASSPPDRGAELQKTPALTAPSRLASFADDPLPGERYHHALYYLDEPGMFNHVYGVDLWLKMDPWCPAEPQGMQGAAYATYHFLLPEYAGEPCVRINSGWPELPPEGVWLALADYQHNTWDWRHLSEPRLDLPSLAPYFDSAGNLYVVVAYCGDEYAELELGWVVIGGNIPPVATIISSTDHGPAPLTVDLEPLGDHADRDGILAEWAWDFEGDGIYDLVCNWEYMVWDFQHTYAQPGEYLLTLRVTDNDGGSDTETLTITVTEPE